MLKRCIRSGIAYIRHFSANVWRTPPLLHRQVPFNQAGPCIICEQVAYNTCMICAECHQSKLILQIWPDELRCEQLR